MRKEDKAKVIEHIATTIKTYGNFYLTDIESLNAEKTSQLRKACFKQDIKLVVVKNTMLRKALETIDGDFSQLAEAMKGNTAIMCAQVPNAPAKLIKEFTKDSDKPAFKAAYVQESFYIGQENFEALVSIKTKNELIGEIVTLLQSPAKNVLSALQSGAQNLHGVLKTLSEK